MLAHVFDDRDKACTVALKLGMGKLSNRTQEAVQIRAQHGEMIGRFRQRLDGGIVTRRRWRRMIAVQQRADEGALRHFRRTGASCQACRQVRGHAQRDLGRFVLDRSGCRSLRRHLRTVRIMAVVGRFRFQRLSECLNQHKTDRRCRRSLVSGCIGFELWRQAAQINADALARATAPRRLCRGHGRAGARGHAFQRHLRSQRARVSEAHEVIVL